VNNRVNPFGYKVPCLVRRWQSLWYFFENTITPQSGSGNKPSTGTRILLLLLGVLLLVLGLGFMIFGIVGLLYPTLEFQVWSVWIDFSDGSVLTFLAVIVGGFCFAFFGQGLLRQANKR